MATDATEAAIAVVARGLLAHAADNLDWEDCPDLGEHDWLRVVQKAQEIAADPSPTDYRIAYDFLAQRASEGMKLRGRSPTELNRTTEVKVDMPSDPTENARASMALRDARASLKAAEKNLDYWESAVASAEQWVEETEGGDPR